MIDTSMLLQRNMCMTRHFQAEIRSKAASSWGCTAAVLKVKPSGRIQKIGKMTDDFGSPSGRLEFCEHALVREMS